HTCRRLVMATAKQMEAKLDQLANVVATLASALGEGHFEKPKVQAPATQERRPKAPEGLLPVGNMGENVTVEYDSKHEQLVVRINLGEDAAGRPSGTGLSTVYASTRGNRPIPSSIEVPVSDLRLNVNLYSVEQTLPWR
ncbi:MAG: hypothetical protein L0177_16030, partial [Chloroflexi bacterium]|nr:hypothetical protein [Chloroflexota bacterium]